MPKSAGLDHQFGFIPLLFLVTTMLAGTALARERTLAEIKTEALRRAENTCVCLRQILQRAYAEKAAQMGSPAGAVLEFPHYLPAQPVVGFSSSTMIA